MKTSKLAAAAGILLSTHLSAAWADGTSDQQQDGSTTISIAGHQVPVVKGGLYDRYRSNPPLAVIEAEAPGVDLSWFKGLRKEKVDIGFESYSPNFYYRNSRVTAIFTADLDKLRELMPAEVLAKVQPLQVWPGRGLVALTAYAYHYCDNDSYNEIGLSVVTNRPGGSNLGPLSLIGQAMSDDFWGYVLKLPVNTELARVRGVVGYNLPKWLTGISYRETDKSVVVEILDSATGQVDVTLETQKLGDLSSKVSMVTNRFTNVDQRGQLTTGYAVSRQLSHASSTSAETVSLGLTEGNLSTFIKSLKLGKMVKYEYVPEFQSALYSPRPL
ncbi:acetoacetate decarboxylase (ADC) [Cupriavidus sp. MP-37]|uniref:acetoacetate decarboxylase (ADC) n=1 Tax=Cupriavidus sp. MP-37 TaxID=2884455 RepID=UPI001D0BACBE|nr:acetoacetate decarboxylase (ADC) [Cupriavidus sp. MP-37]UDM53842.1 acetoacetate decarboxylase (ADC) [Cupriavidus sp. MP-37]